MICSYAIGMYRYMYTDTDIDTDIDTDTDVVVCGVATISRLLKMIGLFCQRAL